MADLQIPPALALVQAACSGDLKGADQVLEGFPQAVRESVHAAAVVGDEQALATLLGGDPSLAGAGLGPLAWTPLFLLAHSHYATAGPDRVQALVASAHRLLDVGADPRAEVPDPELPSGRRTVLCGAAGDPGAPGLCTALLGAGAAANDGVSLFFAVANRRFDCAEILLGHGAKVNEVDATGRFTPLHWVLDARYRRPSVDWLIARGADPNLRAGERRETTLHVAVRRRRRDMVRRLHQAGADLDARTAGGLTAYRHALRRNFGEIAAELARLGADTTTTDADELALALLADDTKRAGGLLAANPGLASAGPEEARLLTDLASMGKCDAVRLLLDAGMDITSRGLDGGTPLHVAAWFGQPEMVALLIERGAPLDVRGDEHDNTPLGWATHGSRYSGDAEGRSAVYVEITERLLAAGAGFPGESDTFDRAQHAGASDAVRAVLERHGWKG
jgi:ankyrin repeat protein